MFYFYMCQNILEWQSIFYASQNINNQKSYYDMLYFCISCVIKANRKNIVGPLNQRCYGMHALFSDMLYNFH